MYKALVCAVAAAALVMLAQNSQALQEEMLEAIPELLRIMRTSGSDALQASLPALNIK